MDAILKLVNSIVGKHNPIHDHCKKFVDIGLTVSVQYRIKLAKHACGRHLEMMASCFKKLPNIIAGKHRPICNPSENFKRIGLIAVQE